MNGVVIWFTGRPASGKSTLAQKVRASLRARGDPSCILDGDAVRATLVPPPGYSPEAREDFYATLAGLAALLANQGLVVLVAATAHRRAYRASARARAPEYLEVYVTATRRECEERDVKHLYEDAAAGRVRGLPGYDIAFETPEAPDVIAVGGYDDDAVARVVEAVDRLRGGAPWSEESNRNASEWL